MFADQTRGPKQLLDVMLRRHPDTATYVVNVGCFSVHANNYFQPLPLLGSGLLCVNFANVVLALGVVEGTRQRCQNVWPVDAESGSHLVFSQSLSLQRLCELGFWRGSGLGATAMALPDIENLAV